MKLRLREETVLKSRGDPGGARLGRPLSMPVRPTGTALARLFTASNMSSSNVTVVLKHWLIRPAGTDLEQSQAAPSPGKGPVTAGLDGVQMLRYDLANSGYLND
jgi:hypothetical protein